MGRSKRVVAKENHMGDQISRPRQPELVADGINYSAGGVQILSNVSLQVANNETVGLLGRDGAGKTSLFELLAGLAAPDSGQILFNDADVTEANAEERARLGLGYLPEEPSIFHGLSAEENIQMALDELEPDPAVRKTRLERLLTSFNLGYVRQQIADSLSGGERRRCEVARTMAAHPAILMLDEPFRGLDPMSVHEVADSILALKKQTVGVLISDYDLHDLIGLIDRAYVLHQGTIIFDGSTDELMADTSVRHLYLGEGFAL